MLYTKRLVQQQTLSRVGGSLSACFAWTPLGTTFFTSDEDAGIEIVNQSKNPKWRRQVQKGINATTSRTFYVIDIKATSGYYEAWKSCVPIGGIPGAKYGVERRQGYIGDGFSDVQVPLVPSTTLNTIVDGQALAVWIKRARAAQGALRGATVLAELADTLRTIRNPARALRSSVDDYSAVARRRIKRAIGRDPRGVRARDLSKRQSRAANRALSDSWLEAQFGWLPLIGDIRSGVEAYNGFADREARQYVSAEVSDSVAPTITIHNSTTRCGDIRTEVHTSAVSTVRYYGAVKLKASSFTSDLAEETGLRVRDFAPALWEWIPYSFLVDYFTNIGDLIEAAALPRGDIAWVSRVYSNTNIRDGSRMTFRVVNNAVWPADGAIKVISLLPSTIQIRRRYVNRSKYTGSLMPPFTVEIPGMRNFKKYLNIAALVASKGMRR